MAKNEIDYSKYNFPEYAKSINEIYEKQRQEKKANEEDRKERGQRAVKGMEEDRMDQMGTAYKKGGRVKSSASKRADGCCIRGKTRA
jgi:hypothetical protein